MKTIYDGVEIEVSEPVLWPIEWLTFRAHPCTDWSGVEKYRRGELTGKPLIVCRSCFVVLDGWHRLADAWQKGCRHVMVQFTDFHLAGAKNECHVNRVNWIHTLRPWVDLECVSGAYHYKDFEVDCFANEVAALRQMKDVAPLMRYWERAKCTIYLGVVENRRILDVGTRESMVPAYLAEKGAQVTAIDLSTEAIYTHPGVEIKQADARDLPFQDNTFDAVVSTACVKHIPDNGDTLAVAEMLRVVKKHGLVAVSFDYGQHYEEQPGPTTGRRLYDKQSVYDRLIDPFVSRHKAYLGEPADFDRSDWLDWPIQAQAPAVFEKGINVQVGFVLLRKRE